MYESLKPKKKSPNRFIINTNKKMISKKSQPYTNKKFSVIQRRLSPQDFRDKVKENTDWRKIMDDALQYKFTNLLKKIPGIGLIYKAFTNPLGAVKDAALLPFKEAYEAYRKDNPDNLKFSQKDIIEGTKLLMKTIESQKELYDENMRIGGSFAGTCNAILQYRGKCLYTVEEVSKIFNLKVGIEEQMETWKKDVNEYDRVMLTGLSI